MTEVTPYQKNRLKDHSYLRAGDVIFKFSGQGQYRAFICNENDEKKPTLIL